MDDQPFVPEILRLDILREAVRMASIPDYEFSGKPEQLAERFERFVMTGSFADKR